MPQRAWNGKDNVESRLRIPISLVGRSQPVDKAIINECLGRAEMENSR